MHLVVFLVSYPPPVGEVICPPGPGIPFAGWLDLMALLDDVLNQRPAATPEPDVR